MEWVFLIENIKSSYKNKRFIYIRDVLGLGVSHPKIINIPLVYNKPATISVYSDLKSVKRTIHLKHHNPRRQTAPSV